MGSLTSCTVAPGAMTVDSEMAVDNVCEMVEAPGPSNVVEDEPSAVCPLQCVERRHIRFAPNTFQTLRSSTSTTASSSLTPDSLQRRMEVYQAEKKDAAMILEFLLANGFRTPISKASFSLLGFWYPLHCAVKANDARMVNLLLRAGADPTRSDWLGRSALRYAMALNRRGSRGAVVAALMSHRRCATPTSWSQTGRLNHPHLQPERRRWQALRRSELPEELRSGLDPDSDNPWQMFFTVLAADAARGPLRRRAGATPGASDSSS